MRTIEIPLTYRSRTDGFRIVFVGDLHLGNAAVDEELVQKVVKNIASDPFTYWVDLGDACDFINMRDRRFDPATVADWLQGLAMVDMVKAQIDRYESLFKPVAPQCLARACGNHESALRLRFERDVYQELNDAMDMPDDRRVGISGFVRLRFRRKPNNSNCNGWTHDIFIHHGAGGGGKSGAVALRLESLPMGWKADTYAMGHTHKKVLLPQRRVIEMENRSGKVTERTVSAFCVGSFMRGEQGGYAETGMMYPAGLGPVDLLLWPDSHEVRLMS